MHKPYSVACPPYSITSGGIRVMYALRSWLEIKGEVVQMNATYDVPFIGIYPEIYHGNELGASTVVRYLLNTPGYMALYGVPSPKTFPKKDRIYCFSQLYNVFDVPESHILFLPVINLHIFKDTHKKRTKTCYLVGKGANTHQHPSDAIELTREFANDQQALADLLNECQMLYCYDPISAMMEVSRLCGCPVKYLGGKTQEELKDYEPGLEGIDFGSGCELNVTEFRYKYEQLRHQFSNRIDRFIEDTQV